MAAAARRARAHDGRRLAGRGRRASRRGQAARPAHDLTHEEPGLADPRHFAYWRRAADVACRTRRRHRGCPRATDGGERGRRGRHARAGLGARRRAERPLRGRLPGPVRRGRPGRPGLAGARPAARPAAAYRAPRRLAHAVPHPDRGRRRPPVAASTRAARRPRRAARRSPSTATRDAETSSASTATPWWPSTGGRWGSGPVGGDLGYLALVGARGARAPAGGLPDRPARRPGHPRPGPVRRPGRRGLHRLEPGRVGAGAGRAGGGRAGREVHPPGRRRRTCARSSGCTRRWKSCSEVCGRSGAARPAVGEPYSASAAKVSHACTDPCS